VDDGQCGNIIKKEKKEKKTLILRVNPTRDLKYIGNKFLQNWSNSRKFMKCPNALKTQSKCGETFLRKKKKTKNLEKLENNFRKKGKLQ